MSKIGRVLAAVFAADLRGVHPILIAGATLIGAASSLFG
jgi:hypothetical protein